MTLKRQKQKKQKQKTKNKKTKQRLKDLFHADEAIFELQTH